MRVKGKVIAITGGTGGLGSAMARRLDEEGAKVYLLDLKGEEVAKDLGLPFIKIDLTSEEDWQRAISRIVAESGRLDVLVNNAGINIRKQIEEMSIEEAPSSTPPASVDLSATSSLPRPIRQARGRSRS